MIYTVIKELEIAGAHRLDLDYESPCRSHHGHNWGIKVICQSSELDKNGMVVDFKKIKEIVNQLDHKYINDIVQVNPTAENIGTWIMKQVPYCIRVEVQESDGNVAIIQSK